MMLAVVEVVVVAVKVKEESIMRALLVGFRVGRAEGREGGGEEETGDDNGGADHSVVLAFDLRK